MQWSNDTYYELNLLWSTVVNTVVAGSFWEAVGFAVASILLDWLAPVGGHSKLDTQKNRSFRF